MENRLLSIDEVALQFNVSTSTVRRWVRSGKLAGQKAGAQWRFDPAAVREAFQRGMLSGASQLLASPITQQYELPEWARQVLMRWRSFLENLLTRLQPDHVIVNDRRGAKVWKSLIPSRYVWGRNLWHSTAIALMTPIELRRIFARQRVLLFDEMMQHGREIHELRECLEAKDVKAVVTSAVCVRRRSHAESGELLEYEAHFCEDLDDLQFGERAALISRLAYLFEPPLDPDHLVLKGRFMPGFKTEELLEKATKWSMPFIVWLPDPEHESMAITLDRPQFFDASNLDLPSGFSFGWDGPGKVRIYGDPRNGSCDCSFVVYPDMGASVSEWIKSTAVTGGRKGDSVAIGGSDVPSSPADEAAFRRFYSSVCINLAVKLLNDFVISGAAEEIGIHFDDSPDTIDVGQILATFGPTLGSEVAKRVRGILAHAAQGKSLFHEAAQHCLSLPIRGNAASQSQQRSCDIFRCRRELLRAVPEKYSASGKQRPISWDEILDRLPQFTECTVGGVLDDELDRGKVKPLIWVDYLSRNGTQIVKVWRGFCRGEFGPWFEWDRHVYGHEDLAIQRTLGLGPTVVESFLKRSGEPRMGATHFDKTFANLQHDLREGIHDFLYLGWRPYKYGPVPVVPTPSPSGDLTELERFLTDVGCLKEVKERHGSQIWRRYKPADENKVPWRDLYRLRIGAVTKAHVAGLMRLYAAIQRECTTTRPSAPRSSVASVFQDPLVVLASVRNQRTMYICGWFEVHDWKVKGELLFALLDSIAIVERRPSEPFLRKYLEDFAAPARLLFDKIEMYRNLPYLRQQVVDLLNRGDLEAGEVLLEKVDLEPIFESQSQWPIKNLEWACRIMRAFSSMTRQVLTTCGLDIEEREEVKKVSDKGKPKDASYYLAELLTSCPELQTLEGDLRTCITNSRAGLLTGDISGCLSRTFRVILNVFESQQRIPDPRPQSESNRERLQARGDLLTTLRGIAVPQPYAVAIADIKNLRNLPHVGELFGTSFEAAMDNLLTWVENVTHDVVEGHTMVQFSGRTGDCIILAGHDANEVLLCTIALINETTRRLGQIDHNQFMLFGLLRAGIAWRDDAMDSEYNGVRPGLIAHDLANVSGQALGTINVTKEVLDRLLPEHQRTFMASTEGCGQGEVFARYWTLEKDPT